MEGKIKGWKELLLSSAGKEGLLKSVVQAIPIYAMSILSFPRSFLKELNALIAKFWWSRNKNARGTHWKSWEVISKSKSERGYGFRDFEFFLLNKPPLNG